jgi:hypothetical protein
MLSSRPQTLLFSDTASENHGVATNKTVKTPSTSTRRRAFGDISNRKAPLNQSKVTVQKRAVSFAASSTKKTISKLAVPSSRAALMEQSVATTPSVESVGPPVEDVEFRAGRPFNPFDGEDDEINLSVDFGSPICDRVSPHSKPPRFWMQHLDFEVTHGLNDDLSLMMAPDEDDRFHELYRIDLSLEEEMNALGMLINDVSF